MPSKTEVDRTIALFLTKPREDFGDTVYTVGSPLALTANTWTDLPNNKGSITDNNCTTEFITEIYDPIEGKVFLDEEYDAPDYVWTITITFDPASSSGETIDFRLKIDSPTPYYIGPDSKPVKGGAEPYSLLLTPYIGALVKQYGLKPQIRSSVAGDVYSINFKIYRT